MSSDSRTPRSEYPKCPRCGEPVAGAMMTSQSIDLGFGAAPRMTYYHPDAISVYCVSADCNYDHKLSDLATPVRDDVSVYVVFRTGKVVKYNRGERIGVEGASFSVHPRTGDYLIARVPMDAVERIEFAPPCIIHEARPHKKATFYEARPRTRAARRPR